MVVHLKFSGQEMTHLLYISTRGKTQPIDAAKTIKLGIAPDGGLFVSEEPARIAAARLSAMAGLTYQQLAQNIFELFLTDYTPEEIKNCIALAYNSEKFDAPAVAPLHRLDNGLYILELWHGPTYAFKDFALQILPHLLTRAIAKIGEKEKIAILVATSGDTGKAALEGFKDVPGTRIIVFYPDQGVSEIQKLQMVTQEGGNVHVIAVKGNFDQAQNGVKAIFGDEAANREARGYGYCFSSANSINWGRLLPQIVYYFYAYLDLAARGELEAGEKINFAVPTGNFGNILAAFYAGQMGLPINRLLLATNQNNVLQDFISTGVYDRNRPFHKTISPSMDILISSNLERLLFECTGRDGEKVNAWFMDLKEKGRYSVDKETHKKINGLFWSSSAGDGETMATIRDVYLKYNYLIDTHTAVGKFVYDRYVQATGDRHKTIIASTASPFKFNQNVVQAIWGSQAVRQKSEFELLEFLARETGQSIPPGLKGLNTKPLRHTEVVDPADMPQVVAKILKA